MEYRPFGRTGLEVSAIGFGCWEIGGGYGRIEGTEFARAVGRALDLGINCFDTAEGYGLGASERVLGQALGRRREEANRRHQVRHELSGHAEPPRQQSRARHGLDRRLLTGTFTPDVDFGSGDWRARADKMGAIKLCDTLFGPEFFPRNLRAAEELKGLAARYGRSLPQLALRWATSNPVVSTALVGCRTVAEVEDNVGALGWSIAEADLAEIDAIFARHGVNTVPDRWVEDD